jgi:hypothetical protein
MRSLQASFITDDGLDEVAAVRTVLHEKYLPFTENQLLSHFLGVEEGTPPQKSKYLDYYIKSIKRYDEFSSNNSDRRGRSFSDLRLPCQIEKDERFWIASSMMTVFYSPNRTEELVNLFRRAYGESPQIEGVLDWKECLSGELHLFFETSLPSPRVYKEWLSENLTRRQFIPYILDSSYQKRNLEGATSVDALLLNAGSGFAIIIEAKVLSDISYGVVYDVMRNQLIRNIDVLMEKNHGLPDPLNKRDPDKTLFLLVTPKLFKDNPITRLYGYKFDSYKINPNSLALDLPHRRGVDWEGLSKRLGWLTFEDFKGVNGDCCKWLG